MLQQLKSGFKRPVNWNKYQSKISTEAQNQYLDFLIDSSFQRVNRLFVLSFENENDRTSHSNYYLPNVEIKDYNSIKTYETIRKTATFQEDDYTTGCLLDYPFL